MGVRVSTRYNADGSVTKEQHTLEKRFGEPENLKPLLREFPEMHGKGIASFYIFYCAA